MHTLVDATSVCMKHLLVAGNCSTRTVSFNFFLKRETKNNFYAQYTLSQIVCVIRGISK